MYFSSKIVEKVRKTWLSNKLIMAFENVKNFFNYFLPGGAFNRFHAPVVSYSLNIANIRLAFHLTHRKSIYTGNLLFYPRYFLALLKPNNRILLKLIFDLNNVYAFFFNHEH